MLKRIISISGRPGLYKLVSQGNNMLIVEALDGGRRLPVYARDKVISLGDVSMYTDDGEDTLLSGVYENLYKVMAGKPVEIKELEAEKKLHDLFSQALPNYDRDRVKTSDIKKAFQWYNALVGAGVTKFVADEEPAAEEPVQEEK